MMKLKITLSIIIVLLNIILSNAQEKNKTSASDFKLLVGNWQGTLTYLDYSSGKPYTMSAELEIKRLDKTNKFIFSNIYPKEPSANSVDTLTISSNGEYIDNELIKLRKKLENGEIEIITEKPGKDGNDNKPAILRYTYTISKTAFKKRKDVQFIGETKWINRHEYSYKLKSRS
ncbi:hypothetical protein IRZ83_05370 [Flavobacterium sp. JLP]|uniref:hypothetical protein n=1 Tax=unclassified Flavobacterium TaxID=196869 RepID=UPI00188A808C|nr:MULTISPECIES: hypothetical protein [unclassified Flavobacterium]MBF4492067.1 hypothetical protein [Flavobacterium sp. MR2016-29]MBF4506091.1 hypothetical protein [Flavobacterium sp. JLP]